MNYVVLVGRLTADPEVKEFGDNQQRTVITLAISRDYRNNNGVYEADFVNCILWNAMASATKDYCHKGDVVGVKAKLQSRSYETEQGEKKYVLDVIADKITFISSNSKKKEESVN